MSKRVATKLTKFTTEIERESPQNADMVARRVLAMINELGRFPNRFTAVTKVNDRMGIVRRVVIEPFVLYYRVIDRTKSVHVADIVHGHQRRPRRFH